MTIFVVRNTCVSSHLHSISLCVIISENCLPQSTCIKTVYLNLTLINGLFMTIFIKVHMFWEDHKILQNLHPVVESTVDLTVTTKLRTNLRWRFRKILWPSQNRYMNFNKTTETSFTKLMFRESFWGADMYRLIIFKKSFFFKNLRILSNHLTNFLDSSNVM